MWGSCVRILLFVAAIISNMAALPDPAPVCRNIFVPPATARGVNSIGRASPTPLFRFQLSAHPSQNGSRTLQSYSLQVHVTNKLVAFSDVQISIETKGGCGRGSLEFDDKDFFKSDQGDTNCPTLLMTNRKSPMMELPPLVWTPPSCGCVHFRALIIEEGMVYYSELETQDKGPLAQVVCVQEKGNRTHHQNALCKVIDRYSAAEILSRGSFLTRHQLETRWMNRYALEMALELRRSDNKICCNKESPDAQAQCFEDTRNHRIDGFCQDGYPDIPFTSFRLAYMRTREKACCYILGHHRYRCFSREDTLNSSDSSVSNLDYSLDEMEPINDLAEFASELDLDILSIIKPLTFDSGNHGLPHASDDRVDNSEEGSDHDMEKNSSGTVSPKEQHKQIYDDKQKGKEQTSNTPTLEPRDVMSGVSNILKRVNSKKTPSAFETVSRGVNSRQVEDSELGQQRRKSKKRVSSKELIVKHILDRTAASDTSRELKKKRKRVKGRRNSVELSSRRSHNQEIDAKISSDRIGSSIQMPLKPSILEEEQGGKSWLTHYTEQLVGGEGAASRAVPGVSSVNRNPLSSAERRVRGPRRDGGDQDITSVEKTLQGIEKKMRRLRLKSTCCQAGASAGRYVYGDFTHAWQECGHSGHKFVRKSTLRSGGKICLDQFRKCCIEMAISGPAMTSSEFREVESFYQTQLPEDLSRGRDMHRDKGPNDGSPRSSFVGRPAPEVYDMDGDRMFDSMREEPSFYEELDDDEEYNGPRNFDEADNGRGPVSEEDPLNRGSGLSRRHRRVKGLEDGEQVDRIDDRSLVDEDEIDEDDDDLDAPSAISVEDQMVGVPRISEARNEISEKRIKVLGRKQTSRERETKDVDTRDHGHHGGDVPYRHQHQPEKPIVGVQETDMNITKRQDADVAIALEKGQEEVEQLKDETEVKQSKEKGEDVNKQQEKVEDAFKIQVGEDTLKPQEVEGVIKPQKFESAIKQEKGDEQSGNEGPGGGAPEDLHDELKSRTMSRMWHHRNRGSSNLEEFGLDDLQPARSKSSRRNRQSGGRSRGKQRSRSRSRNSRRRSSRRSSRENQERRYSLASQRHAARASFHPLGTRPALDSQEMADVHYRRFMAPLDSKEMVDAFRKKGSGSSRKGRAREQGRITESISMSRG